MFSSADIHDVSFLWVILFILLGLLVVVGKKASASEAELNPDVGCKSPILAFEFNAGAAPDMFKSWDEETKSQLRTALLWDYLFIFIYPAFIATACFIAGKFLDDKGIIPFKYAIIVICLQLLAAIFDAIENYALLRILQGPIENPWPQIAKWCAIVKFGIIFVGVGYIVVGFAAWLFMLIRRR